MNAINFKREIWEGWTVKDFIDEIEPILDMIMRGEAIRKPFRTKQEMGEYATYIQPYYKKDIPEVVEYFAEKYDLI